MKGTTGVGPCQENNLPIVGIWNIQISPVFPLICFKIWRILTSLDDFLKKELETR